MQKRYFHVLYLSDDSIRDCLDLIRFVCNPDEKGSAHITIGGPYKVPPNREIASTKIEGTTISVFGAGKFFQSNQRTVYLRCGSEIMRQIWKKKDYGFNPHITLYDGHDREISEKLFNLLREYNFYFKLTSGRLQILESVKGQKDLSLICNLNLCLLHQAAGYHLEPQAVRHLSSEERLVIVDKLCRNLKKLTEIKDEKAVGQIM